MTVRVRGVSLARGGRALLRGVDLEVGAGERVLLLGDNGAGKSTLLRVVVGLVRPDAGTVEIDGRAATEAGSRAAVGYVGDPKRLPEHDTPLSLLREVVALHGRGSPDGVIERLGLTGCASRPIRTLSTSERARTAIARALAIRPTVLILDEPLSGLDGSAQKTALQAISETGAATLIANPVDDLPADRRLRLVDGRIAAA